MRGLTKAPSLLHSCRSALSLASRRRLPLSLIGAHEPGGARRFLSSEMETERSSGAYADWDEQPVDVTFADVSTATYRLRTGISRTILHQSRKMSSLLGCDVYFKNEFQHPTGSFKERGGRNALLLLGACLLSARGGCRYRDAGDGMKIPASFRAGRRRFCALFYQCTLGKGDAVVAGVAILR